MGARPVKLGHGRAAARAARYAVPARIAGVTTVDTGGWSFPCTAAPAC